MKYYEYSENVLKLNLAIICTLLQAIRIFSNRFEMELRKIPGYDVRGIFSGHV